MWNFLHAKINVSGVFRCHAPLISHTCTFHWKWMHCNVACSCSLSRLIYNHAGFLQPYKTLSKNGLLRSQAIIVRLIHQTVKTINLYYRCMVWTYSGLLFSHSFYKAVRWMAPGMEPGTCLYPACCITNLIVDAVTIRVC